MKIELKSIDARIADLSRATSGAAAVDLRVCSVDGLVLSGNEESVISPGDRIKVGTGLAIDLGSAALDENVLPHESMVGMENFFGFHGYAALVIPRSGLGSKGIVLSNLVGLIDGDYQGEIFVSLWNAGNDYYRVNALDRVAQLLVIPVAQPIFQLVPEFSRSTDRGENGFGSTGRA